jgi:HSP20 family protein
MAIVRWDPTRDLDTLQGDVNRLFDSFFGRREGSVGNDYGSRRWIPAMDLVETDEHLVLRADLPGVDRDNVEIEVKDGVLTISGERRAEHEDKREGFHRVERSFGRFSRALELPQGIAADSVQARFERGVLELRMPKPEERKPTRIEIEGEDRELEAAGARDSGS